MYFELSHLLTYFYDKIAKATVKTLHITYMVHSSWVPTQISVIMHEIILENIISHQSMKKKISATSTITKFSLGAQPQLMDLNLLSFAKGILAYILLYSVNVMNYKLKLFKLSWAETCIIQWSTVVSTK